MNSPPSSSSSKVHSETRNPIDFENQHPEPKSLYLTIYLTLIFLRICCSFLPGYIHPDEFFQGGQELFFGFSGSTMNQHENSSIFKKIHSYKTEIPWEFQSENAIRSIVPPVFMTLLPLNIYSFLCTVYHHMISFCDFFYDTSFVLSNENENGCYSFTGYQILIIPRLFLAFCSILALDLPTYHIFRHIRKQHKNSGVLPRYSSHLTELIVLASSWPILLFSNRPFTNTLETMVLTILIAVVVVQSGVSDTSTQRKHSIKINIIVGTLCSIGFFVRFTFLFYAFPVVLYFVYMSVLMELNRSVDIQKQTGTTLSHQSSSSFVNTSKIIQLIISTISWMCVGFFLCSALFIQMDSKFYNQQQLHQTECSTMHKKVFITPLNALLYNSKIDNLSSHGLHPRITHLLVNMPMLYGSLAIVFYFSIIKKIWRRLFFTLGMNKENAAQMKSYSTPTTSSTIFTMCRSVILCGLFVLSCAPHQEPRFLLPAVVPMIILHGRNTLLPNILENDEDAAKQTEMKSVQHPSIPSSLVIWKLAVWAIFNSLMFIFFGTLHQSGVIPSLRSIAEINDNHVTPPEAIIYFRTYMPPTFLSRVMVRSGNYLKLQSDCNTLHNDDSTIKVGKQTNSPVYSSSCLHECNDPSIKVVTKTRNEQVHNEWPIFDLKTSDNKALQSVLKELLICNDFPPNDHDNINSESGVKSENKKDNSNATIYIVAPTVSMENDADVVGVESMHEKIPTSSYCSSIGDIYYCQKIWSQSWHLSTEDMPTWNGKYEDFISDLSLAMYQVSCSS